MDLGISTYSMVTPEGVFKNGSLLFENQGLTSFDTFIKDAYRFINPSYPKFFKMDELCKLSFVATEVLLSDKNILSGGDGSDVAIIVGNKHSSIVSDRKHADSFKDKSNYFPSPAVFVYTLPNIMLGEICIRHQITGENTCFVLNSFKADLFYEYVQDLFENEQYNYCIVGWVDNSSEDYYAALFLIEKKTNENNLLKKFDRDFSNIIPI